MQFDKLLYFINLFFKLMQDKITSLITDDRVDEVYHNETSPERVH